MIDAVGRKSLGLAVDTFHFHVSGSSLEDLRQCRPRAIALLRLADAPEGERETLRDHHRLVPGTGVAPVRAVLGVVKSSRGGASGGRARAAAARRERCRGLGAPAPGGHRSASSAMLALVVV